MLAGRDDTAREQTDPRREGPGSGDGVAVLAQDADRRARAARSEQERNERTRAAARLWRVAALQGAFGQAQLAGAEDFDQAVVHSLPYGPGLKARWDALPTLERTVLALRYGHPDGDAAPAGPASPVETTQRLGLDRESVRRLESKGRWRLA